MSEWLRGFHENDPVSWRGWLKEVAEGRLVVEEIGRKELELILQSRVGLLADQLAAFPDREGEIMEIYNGLLGD